VLLWLGDEELGCDHSSGSELEGRAELTDHGELKGGDIGEPECKINVNYLYKIALPIFNSFPLV